MGSLVSSRTRRKEATLHIGRLAPLQVSKNLWLAATRVVFSCVPLWSIPLDGPIGKFLNDTADATLGIFFGYFSDGTALDS